MMDLHLERRDPDTRLEGEGGRRTSSSSVSETVANAFSKRMQKALKRKENSMEQLTRRDPDTRLEGEGGRRTEASAAGVKAGDKVNVQKYLRVPSEIPREGEEQHAFKHGVEPELKGDKTIARDPQRSVSAIGDRVEKAVHSSSVEVRKAIQAPRMPPPFAHLVTHGGVGGGMKMMPHGHMESLLRSNNEIARAKLLLPKQRAQQQGQPVPPKRLNFLSQISSEQTGGRRKTPLPKSKVTDMDTTMPMKSDKEMTNNLRQNIITSSRRALASQVQGPITPHGMLLPPREPAAGMLVNPLIRGLDHGVDNSHQNNYKNSRPLPRGSQPPHGGRGVPVSSPPRVAPAQVVEGEQISNQADGDSHTMRNIDDDIMDIKTQLVTAYQTFAQMNNGVAHEDEATDDNGNRVVVIAVTVEEDSTGGTNGDYEYSPEVAKEIEQWQEAMHATQDLCYDDYKMLCGPDSTFMPDIQDRHDPNRPPCGGPLGFGSRENDMCLKQQRNLIVSSRCVAAMEVTESLFRDLKQQGVDPREAVGFGGHHGPQHVGPHFPLVLLLLFICCGCYLCVKRRRCKHRKRMKRILEALATQPELKSALEVAAGTPLPVLGWKNKVFAAIEENPQLQEAVESAIVARTAEKEEAKATEPEVHQNSLFKLCKGIFICSGIFMLFTIFCSLAFDSKSREVEDNSNSLAGFAFAVLGGFIVMFVLSFILKFFRCVFCSQISSSEPNISNSTSTSEPPLVTAVLPSFPLLSDGKSNELTVHLLSDETPPKPLEAL